MLRGVGEEGFEKRVEKQQPREQEGNREDAAQWKPGEEKGSRRKGRSLVPNVNSSGHGYR